MDKEDVRKIINDLIGKHSFDGISIYNMPAEVEVDDEYITYEDGDVINISLRLIKEEK